MNTFHQIKDDESANQFYRILHHLAVFRRHEDLFPELKDLEDEEVIGLLLSIDDEKASRDEITDDLLDYDDEIVSIEELDVQESMDITVSGDNLFYANGILTKNSFGLAHTADLIIALMSNEKLDEMNQIQVKQLKNRYGDLGYYNKFLLGCNKAKMQLYDLEDDAQVELNAHQKTDAPVSNIDKFTDIQW